MRLLATHTRLYARQCRLLALHSCDSRIRHPAFLRRSSSLAYIDEEALSSFDPSKYYPVHLGDSIKGLYTVKAKLGYGRSSTTWLCKDKDNAFKVLKITTSDANSQEARVLRHLDNCPSTAEHPGRDCVRRPEDVFGLSSKAGNHHCLIFEPLGPSLLEFTSSARAITLGSQHVQWIAIYLLHALDFLHSSDVVHTDIKLDNIQITLPNDGEELLQSFIMSEEQSPSPMKSMEDGNVIYKSREMSQEVLGYPILCDLGSAVFASERNTGVVQALPYRAPEVILGAKWDYKVDVWNLGVLTWELLFGERLFGQTSELDSIRLMIQYLGYPPGIFLQRCGDQSNFFDDQGYWKHGQMCHTRLEDRVESDTAMPLLFDFLRCALKWDPAERSSASELLDHSWLKDL